MQFQNITTSDSESVNGERQLHSACQVSCGQPLWQSPSSPHQFSLDVAALFASSIIVSCQKPTHPFCTGQRLRVRVVCARAWAGVQRVIYVRGHFKCVTDKYIYIVALAEIRPPHCTISCLASRSAINTRLPPLCC